MALRRWEELTVGLTGCDYRPCSSGACPSGGRGLTPPPGDVGFGASRKGQGQLLPVPCLGPPCALRRDLQAAVPCAGPAGVQEGPAGNRGRPLLVPPWGRPACGPARLVWGLWVSERFQASPQPEAAQAVGTGSQRGRAARHRRSLRMLVPRPLLGEPPDARLPVSGFVPEAEVPAAVWPDRVAGPGGTALRRLWHRAEGVPCPRGVVSTSATSAAGPRGHPSSRPAYGSRVPSGG